MLTKSYLVAKGPRRSLPQDCSNVHTPPVPCHLASLKPWKWQQGWPWLVMLQYTLPSKASGALTRFDFNSQCPQKLFTLHSVNQRHSFDSPNMINPSKALDRIFLQPFEERIYKYFGLQANA